MQATRLSSMHIEIVRGCQLRCQGCPVSGLKPKVGRIAPELFERCLRNVDVKHIDVLRLFNFGEPLLHEGLPLLLEIVKRQAWSAGEIEISTNAQLADWAMLEQALRQRVLTRLVVSCDGDGTPASYEALRPPAKWEKLLDFLRGMRELRDRLCPELELMTRTIVPSQQAQEHWRELLEPLGWRPEFRPAYYLPDSAQNITGRALRPGDGVCFFVQGPNLYVDADGLVVPCCAHPSAGMFGSLRDQTYREILAGSERLQFVQALATRRREMPICGSCEFGPPSAPGPFLAELSTEEQKAWGNSERHPRS